MESASSCWSARHLQDERAIRMSRRVRCGLLGFAAGGAWRHRLDFAFAFTVFDAGGVAALSALAPDAARLGGLLLP